jgi:methionyl-tRNA formyltransferase
MNNKYSQFLYVYYRDWAEKAYNEICLDLPFVTNNEDLLRHIEKNRDLKYIFFVGWSDLIGDEIINSYSCFCVHPSMLPLYRGGSPIQNQIIDGILDSGVTLFKMNNKIDAGPIFMQKFLSLRGTLDEIFTRISFISADLIRSFILKIEIGETVFLNDQDDEKATLYKRRKPSQSEIKVEEIENSSALQLYNKIRSLDDPYPNAYIKCADGRKLILKKVSIG